MLQFPHSPMSIADLPPELLLAIFRNLLPSDCFRLARVCKLWYNLLEHDSLWKEFIKKYYKNRYDKLIGYLISPSQAPHSLQRELSHKLIKPSLSSASGVQQPSSLPWKTIYAKVSEVHGNWLTGSHFAQELGIEFERPIRQIQLRGNILTLCSGPIIQCWNLCNTTKILFDLCPSPRYEVKSFQSIDSTRLFCTAGQYSNEIHTYNPTTGELIHQYGISGDSIQCLKFDYAHGNRLLTGGRQVCLWDLACTDKYPLLTLKEQHRGIVNCIELHQNLLVCTHKGKKIRIFDVRTGKRVFTLQGHTHLIHTIGINDYCLVSGSKDTTLRIWDARQGFAVQQVLEHHTSSVRCLQVDDWKIVSGAKDGSVYIHNLESLETRPALLGKLEPIYSLAMDDSFAFVGSTILRELNFTTKKSNSLAACTVS